MATYNKLVNMSRAKIPEAYNVITLAFGQASKETDSEADRQTDVQIP